MLKLLIADDEHYICKLIKRLIAWNELGLECVATATNGNDCYELIQRYQPDIVITDIHMPGLSGLDIIKNCADDNIECRFIIVSGYAEFEYAQTALKYGVNDYLIKPINKTELNDALENVIKALGKNNIPDNQNKSMVNIAARNTLLLSLLHNDFNTGMAIETINREYGFRFEKGYFLPVIVRIDSPAMSMTQNKNNLASYKKRLESEITEFCYCLHFTDYGTSFICLLNYAEKDHQNVSMSLQYNFNLMTNQILAYDRYHLTMGWGEPVKDASLLQKSFNKAVCAVESRIVLGHDKIILGTDMDTSLLDNMRISIQEPNRRLALPLENLDLETILMIANEEYQRQMPEITRYPYCLGNYSKKFVSALLRDIHTAHNLNITAELEDGVHIKIDKSLSAEEILKHILSTLETLIKQLQSSHPDIKSIKIIKQYIDLNYDKKLKLEDLAELVYLSPAYLGIMFKRETGQNLSDYIADIRIDKSQELLKDITYNINEVSEIVGYKDTRYFSKLFKKTVGVTPTQYRKLFMRNDTGQV